MRKGIGGHQSADMRTDEWLTPRELITSLGEFDLDPCAPVNRPWPMAKHHYTIEDDGLKQPWFGRVFLNPPYGNLTMRPWLELMRLHANGIALTFARTETENFHRLIYPYADGILFLEGRLTFYTAAGTKAKANGGAPSVLIAYGDDNVQAMVDSPVKGRLWRPNSIPVVVVGVSPSWTAVISIALSRLNGEAAVDQVYKMVELIAPDKVKNNAHYKEKIRQKLQTSFQKIRRGFYKRP